VKSTSRIEVLISIPISATKPIIAVNDNVFPVRKSARMPPMMPSGITEATISVPRNVLNSSTSTARIMNVATISALPMPPKLSWRLSISPAGTMR
jgi:hypothetical protein